MEMQYLADVDLSFSLLDGPILLPNVEIELLDLSNNSFSSSIPQNISESMSTLIFLSLLGNKLIGGIPTFIGEMLLLLQVSGFGFRGLGFGVWGLGFRVWGPGSRDDSIPHGAWDPQGPAPKGAGMGMWTGMGINLVPEGETGRGRGKHSPPRPRPYIYII
ncbi:hypothetical protein Dsin_026625 [Dipteronia sinensis]|uniref:Uncharacterized protein n=1 Tax=Dipteronia sinensis TaxID=43782 RepID=A0AAE0DY01_9ROSI|nr:hypothetical protein Dsin_026625 [Dipteronia sinensis]